MKYFRKLVGKRIYLSPMNLEDAEIFAKWQNDLEVTNALGNSTGVMSLENEKEWLKNNIDKHVYAIVTLEDDRLIGNCGFQVLDQARRCGEIAIYIGDEEYRNKGYGTEALKLLLDFGFDYLNLQNVILKVFSFNERAIRCYKKVGFKEIGKRRQSYYLKGTYYDELYMDILREEYGVNS